MNAPLKLNKIDCDARSAMLFEHHAHELDIGLWGNGENSLVTVKLEIQDPFDAAVGDKLEATPARGSGDVDIGAIDGGPVLGGLNDGIGLGMNGRDTVAVFKHMADIVAVRQPPYAAVIPG